MIPLRFRLPLLATLSSLVLFVISFYSVQPPAAKPVDAPESEFSAVRAHNLLKELLVENKPHPVGSSMNKVVKHRIMAELDRLDISYEEQQTWSCRHQSGVCARVENIVALIDGKTDGIVTLMAHYDSVPASAGAGDDGSGVVAILEAARALKLEAPFEQTIMLLFTDAEEVGLIGAEAFFNQHLLARKVNVVLNLEGSGTSGSSIVLRTTTPNEVLINAVVNETAHPNGISFTNEIFKRMPNDTDFSVVMRAGIPGIDFAFAGERNHYHTPNDNIDNIDLDTIQHHGEHLLPLARKLAQSDLGAWGDQVVYGAAYGVWIQWTTEYSLSLLLVVGVLLGFAVYRTSLTLRGCLTGFVVALVILVSVLLMSGVFEALKLITGTLVSWPAYDTPFRALVFFSAIFGSFLPGLFFIRRIGLMDYFFGTWLFWFALTIPVVFLLPDAANVFLVPIVAASIVMIVASFVSETFRPYILALTLLFLIPSTLGFVHALEQSQGYRLIAGVYFFIALFAVCFMPFFHGIKLLPVVIGSGLGILISVAVILSLPVYSQWRPQPAVINYTENTADGTAYLQLSSPYPIDEAIVATTGLLAEEQPIFPFSEIGFSNWVISENSDWKEPELQVQQSTINNETRSVDVKLISHRGAESLFLLIPVEHQLTSATIGNTEITPSISSRGISKGYNTIRLIGTYGDPVSLRLLFNSTNSIDDAYLMDISSELPESAEDLLKIRRDELAVYGRGDQAYLIKQVAI